MSKAIAKTRTTRTRPRGKAGWQAEKSAMTRGAILDAAVECFIDLGYASTTTALIAEYAGVSRGAMMHHFPSRLSVMTAVVEYLHGLRLAEYRQFMANIDVPDQQLSRERIRESVEGAWKYVNTRSFVAYQELMAASRTDPDLNSVLLPIEEQFEREFMDSVKTLFPHWQELGALDTANDLVQFLMLGMALSHMAERKEERAARILDLLTDILEQLYSGEYARVQELENKPKRVRKAAKKAG